MWELPEFAPGYAAGTFDDRYDEEPLDEREKRVRRERAELLRDDGTELVSNSGAEEEEAEEEEEDEEEEEEEDDDEEAAVPLAGAPGPSAPPAEPDTDECAICQTEALSV